MMFESQNSPLGNFDTKLKQDSLKKKKSLNNLKKSVKSR